MSGERERKTGRRGRKLLLGAAALSASALVACGSSTNAVGSAPIPDGGESDGGGNGDTGNDVHVVGRPGEPDSGNDVTVPVGVVPMSDAAIDVHESDVINGVMVMPDSGSD